MYEASGQYQLYVEDMRPEGIGALNLAFEQLKQKLEKEGLFSPQRKRPILPISVPGWSNYVANRRRSSGY